MIEYEYGVSYEQDGEIHVYKCGKDRISAESLIAALSKYDPKKLNLAVVSRAVTDWKPDEHFSWSRGFDYDTLVEKLVDCE